MSILQERWFIENGPCPPLGARPKSHNSDTLAYFYQKPSKTGRSVLLSEIDRVPFAIYAANEGGGEVSLKNPRKWRKVFEDNKNKVVTMIRWNLPDPNPLVFAASYESHEGPTGEIISVVKFLFSSEEEARVFKPPLWLNPVVEIDNHCDYSRYSIWLKLTGQE